MQHSTVFLHYATDVLDRYPLLSILLGFIVLDIFAGTAAAFVSKKVSSNVSFRGMTKKAACLFVVSAVAAIDLVTGFPMSRIVALFYIYTECISILEACAAMGVPLPPQLLDVLIKLRSGDKMPMAVLSTAVPVVAPAPQQVVINARAVSVRQPAGQTQRIELPGDAARTTAIQDNTDATRANTAAQEVQNAAHSSNPPQS